MLTFAGLVLGIAILIAGGTLLVRGASEIASTFGVSPMVVGLTIVGFGTSSPELVINIIGASTGATGIAFGNVVGSNISNLALVLGAAALMHPIVIQSALVRRELPLLLLVTTITTVMALDGPLEGGEASIGRTDAIVLMLLFCIFVYITVLDLMRVRHKDHLLAEIEISTIVVKSTSSRFQWLFVAAGLGLLYAGGHLTIDNGVALATELGVSTAIVGLFVVAVGTSMPELVTSAIAVARRESDLALGNIIGSNIFNSLVVLPASGVIAAVPVPPGGVGDLVMSWVLAASLLPVFFFGRALLGRRSGAILLLVYLAYAVARVAMQ